MNNPEAEHLKFNSDIAQVEILNETVWRRIII